MDSKSLQYRPDIDGLRAISVLGVLIFHLFPGVLPGGFLGVDVFFVISGCLISQILWSSIWREEFRLRDFYSRRVRRIVPALATVLLAAWALGTKLLYWDEFTRLGKHIFASSFFFMNFVQMGEGGYFDILAERKPLLHLWSLSIEEQFYVCWPILLLILGKRRRLTLTFLLGGLVASFVLNLCLGRTEASTAFYSPLCRAWELLVGAAVGFWTLPSRLESSSLQSRKGMIHLSNFAILLILGSFCFLSKSSGLLGLCSALPCVAAGILLFGDGGRGTQNPLLSSALLVGIGRISYPLYLWHWTLYSFLFLVRRGEVSLIDRWALCFISIVLAVITYLFIERPLQRREAKPSLVLALLLALVCVGMLGRMTQVREGFVRRNQSSSPFLSSPKTVLDWLPVIRPDKCHIQAQTYAVHAPECFEEKSPHVVLWGDSHAAALYPGLKELQKSRTFGLTQWTQAGCPPLFEVDSIFQSDCRRINEDVFNRLLKLQPEILILHAGWIHHHYPLSNEEILSKFQDSMRIIQAKLPKTHVVVIGPLPRWEPSLPELLNLYKAERGSEPPRSLEPPRSALNLRLESLDEELARQTRSLGLLYVSPRKIICEESLCLDRFGDSSDELLVVDDSHLTEQGSRFFVSHLLPEIFPH